MIRFACPKCDKVYRAEPDQAGRQMECKQCKAVVVVPQVESSEPAEPLSNPADAELAAREEKDFAPKIDGDDDDVPIRSRRKAKAPSGLLIGLFLVVGLAVAVAVMMVVAARRQSGGDQAIPAKPAATEKERSKLRGDDFDQVLAELSAIQREAEARHYRAVALYLTFCLLYLAVSILLAIWVIRDSRNRAEGFGFFWMLMIFPLNVIGLAIYLGARPSGELKACENCGHRRLEYLTFCPHCRYDFQAEGRIGRPKK